MRVGECWLRLGGVREAALGGSVAFAFGCVAFVVAFGGHLGTYIRTYIHMYIYIYTYTFIYMCTQI